MDRVELYSGGFPVTTTTFDFLQDAYGKEIKALTALGGDTFILEGVQVAGGNVTKGSIVHNGEYLPFVGGAFNGTVGIFENVQEVAYNEDTDNDGNLDNKRAYVQRYAKCGTGGLESFGFDLLKRFTPLTGLSMPVGMITMWSGAISDIPKGWALCDGSNGTPNLRDRFLVGAGGEYAVGQLGGKKEVTLTEAQMPKHSHKGSTEGAGSHRHTGRTHSAGSHTHNVPNNTRESAKDVDNSSDEWGGHKNVNQYVKTNAAGSHIHTLNIDIAANHTHAVNTLDKGGGQAHENRPPYYALALIMFKGL
ncbi:hypothetical protein [Flagellimonas onchidii]|uniref:hypothetical protein n=1 Tax=Flagellimonas onchidii TaxID=2562684 RepID=UPI0010A66BFF|nr:hypothetical protein [Allomuricauda onchidii]